MSDIQPGHTVYDRSGLTYEFVEALSNNRALVRPILRVWTYEGGEEDAPAEAVEIVSMGDISRTKPIASIDAEISLAADKLASIRAEIREAEAGLSAAQKSAVERITKLQKFNGLERLEDYLDGAITHFVVQDPYYNKVSVKTFEEFAAHTDDRGRATGEIKLLCLFGSTKDYWRAQQLPSVEWRMNHYYDGSGSWTKCQPACSEEEAVLVAKEWLKSAFDAYLIDTGDKRPWLMEGPIQSAEKLDIEVPQQLLADLKAHKGKAAAANVEKARKALAEAEALASTGGAA
ncbi:hypothetical protein [Sphingomonas crocodyli]|uniref:Uncharacterized protein n=1 Tax=Sphingomonas crocodyli TaxID=1979270 RepID=A0A437M7M2_9SPHN|nr:hypothetical protein [Sphingomonas crocodyli]RVT93731.1 hypothetical protein EOD43_07650 [Sphingomonas crocodyli]